MNKIELKNMNPWPTKPRVFFCHADGTLAQYKLAPGVNHADDTLAQIKLAPGVVRSK